MCSRCVKPCRPSLKSSPNASNATAKTLRQLESQVNHLMRELEQARRESTTDPLTGLYNRRAFEDCLNHTIGLNRLFGYPATMMLIDIDHFKQVNDAYGHTAGDAVLKAVAEQIVRVCKRRSDFAARYGGEEFAVILRETTLREAQRIAHQLAQQVRRAAHPDSRRRADTSHGLYRRQRA
jgi:diguanylate cyclase